MNDLKDIFEKTKNSLNELLKTEKNSNLRIRDNVSGVYFITVNFNNTSMSQKIVLVK
tara:strand:+ start:168 stop:338 length:171 start_codon:yes stop_codon:yes gene_type:complete